MVVIDFETYYSKEFSLSKITTEEYIRSPQFEVIGVCVKEDDGPVEWITGTLEARPLHRLLPQHGVRRCHPELGVRHPSATAR